MKILVTGGSGFIGSAVIRKAIKDNHSIVNVDALTYASNLKNLESVENSPLYKFENVNINSAKDLKEVFERHRPDRVMHLAAESHVDRSIEGPYAFMETNILGTFNLLQVSKDYVKTEENKDNFRFHHISTDEVFGSLGEDGLFSEDTPYNPNSPYSASKASSDHLVRAWGATYGLPVLITNCSNNYGPYQHPEKLIPKVIINIIRGEKIPVYGNGKNIRDWLYVEDHAEALLLVLEKGEIGRSYNIGGMNEAENIQIIEKICGIIDSKLSSSSRSADLIAYVDDRQGHDQRYAIDSSRIDKEMGWKPKISIDEGLIKTVDWYLSNQPWWQ